jgi:uncharacterized protein (DUF342 family)
MSREIKIENGFGFRTSPDGYKLMGVVVPSDDKLDLTSDNVRQRLKDEDIQLFVNEYLLGEFIRRYHLSRTTNESFEIEIGERKDAVCEINLSRDKMRATLWLAPSFGGRKITTQDILSELEKQGIVFGVVPKEKIDELIQKGQIENFIIAQGIDPIPGIDAQFQSFIQEIEHAPQINEDGTVDFRELGDVVTVTKGEPLMRRIPATRGTDGRNVLGQEVPTQRGIDSPLSVDKNSTYLDPEDRNQLLAAITGQPIIGENGVTVLPVLTLDNVDLGTGNIRFNGTVIVKGDVIAGMKIFAFKDVLIDGEVVNADIECLGNLTIKGGVSGNSQLIVSGTVNIKLGVQGEKDVGEAFQEAKIVANGAVTLGFSENFLIESDSNIIIQKYSLHCKLMAKNRILVGSRGTGKKASIMGGTAWATKFIKASSIGSEAGLKTIVRVGSDPQVEQAITQIKQSLEQNKKKQQEIRKAILSLDDKDRKNKEEMLGKLNSALNQMIFEADSYENELSDLRAMVVFEDDAKIVADRNVYAGTTVQISRAIWQAKQNYGKTTFLLERNQIVTK